MGANPDDKYEFLFEFYIGYQLVRIAFDVENKPSACYNLSIWVALNNITGLVPIYLYVQ